MPSTYTLNNGIELIATGEQSGTWGDTTNVNLALIDTALDGQVTITLASAGSSGSPNALAISDGSASNGRNRLIIFDDGGDLGATAFVQLTPNDAEKIVYIRNNLSGGRAITLFQGTYNASNDYEVPAGTTAVVFFNGGGAGAVAANVFNNAFFDSLRLGAVSVTAILDEDNMASDSATALATQQSIKAYVDAQVGANNELSEILANGNTSGGNNIQMTTTDEVQFRDTALKISSSVDGQLDIAADVELEIVAPTLDINASTAVTIDTTTMTMTGSVNVVGDLDVDNLNINGNSIISTNTDGNIALTPNGTGEVDISKVDIDGGTIDGTVIGGSTPAAIGGTAGQFGTSLNVDGTVTANGVAIDGDSITANAQNALTFEFATATGIISADRTGGNFGELSLRTTAGSTPLERLKISYDGDISFYDTSGNPSFVYDESVGSTFNEQGADRDFRVESDTDTHAFFVDAASNNVGIGTSSPASKLEVASGNLTVSGDAIATVGQIDLIRRGILSSSAGVGIINFQGYSTGTTVQTGARIQAEGAGTWTSTSTPANVLFYTTPSASTSPVERMRITSSGGIEVPNQNAIDELTFTGTDFTNVFSATTSGFQLGTTGAGYLAFLTDNTERARIDASGTLIHKLAATFNEDGADADFRVESDSQTHALFVDAGTNSVGIADSAPGASKTFADTTVVANFFVNSNVATNGPMFQYDKAGVFLGLQNDVGSGTRYFISFGETGTRLGDITSNGSVMTYGGTSDYRLKTNVQPMTGAIDRVKALNPVTFDWISSGISSEGFIAHELQSVIPDAATGTKDEVNAQGKPVYQQVDPRHVVSVLTAALQEAIAKIETLEARIAALENA